MRCIFKHDHHTGILYEERIVLVKASSFDEAIERGEREAVDYVSTLGDVEYLGDAEAFHIAEQKVGDLTEVFSLMRESELDPNEYVATFFQTGRERSR